MTLEEAKETLKNIKRCCLDDEQYQKYGFMEQYIDISDVEAIDTALKALDNSISKDEVKKTVTKYTEEYHKYIDGMERKLSHLKDDHKIRATYAEFGILKGKVDVLQELLGE